MREPSLAKAVEALAFALALPALVSGVAALNPILGIWIAGIGLVHGVVLGLPLFLLLRRFGWVNVATSTVSGMVIGAAPAAAIFASLPGQSVPFACFGGASGFLFGAWLWLRARGGSNPSIERTAKGLRPSSAAHVER